LYDIDTSNHVWQDNNMIGKKIHCKPLRWVYARVKHCIGSSHVCRYSVTFAKGMQTDAQISVAIR